MSRKQEIYAELLRHSLPMARNALSHRFIYGNKREEAFRICQLTHDLYVSILDDGFNEHDIWFLNVHAREYVSRAQECVLYQTVVELLRQLFSEVPTGMRNQLEWAGP